MKGVPSLRLTLWPRFAAFFLALILFSLTVQSIIENSTEEFGKVTDQDPNDRFQRSENNQRGEYRGDQTKQLRQQQQQQQLIRRVEDYHDQQQQTLERRTLDSSAFEGNIGEEEDNERSRQELKTKVENEIQEKIVKDKGGYEACLQSLGNGEGFDIGVRKTLTGCIPHFEKTDVDFNDIYPYLSLEGHLGHGLVKEVKKMKICGSYNLAYAKRKRHTGIKNADKIKARSGMFEKSVKWLTKVKGYERHYPQLVSVCQTANGFTKGYLMKMVEGAQHLKNFFFSLAPKNAKVSSDIHRNSLPVRLQVAIDYAHVLADLHNELDEPNFDNQTFIFCDHKFENIVVDSQYHVKILDVDSFTCIDCDASRMVTCGKPLALLQKITGIRTRNAALKTPGYDLYFYLHHMERIIYAPISAFSPPPTALSAKFSGLSSTLNSASSSATFKKMKIVFRKIFLSLRNSHYQSPTAREIWESLLDLRQDLGLHLTS